MDIRKSLNAFQTEIIQIIDEYGKEDVAKNLIYAEPFPEYSEDSEDFIWVKILVHSLEIWVYRDSVDITKGNDNDLKKNRVKSFLFESIDYENDAELMRDFLNKFISLVEQCNPPNN